METEGPVLCSQQLTIGPCIDPDESIPQIPALFP